MFSIYKNVYISNCFYYVYLLLPLSLPSMLIASVPLSRPLVLVTLVSWWSCCFSSCPIDCHGILLQLDEIFPVSTHVFLCIPHHPLSTRTSTLSFSHLHAMPFAPLLFVCTKVKRCFREWMGYTGFYVGSHDILPPSTYLLHHVMSSFPSRFAPLLFFRTS